MLLLALALAVWARSGTGVVALMLLAAGRWLDSLPRRWRFFPVVIGLLALTQTLPKLLGRPQLFDSPSGRVRTLRVWIQSPHTAQERLWGYGAASQNHPQRSVALARPSPCCCLPKGVWWPVVLPLGLWLSVFAARGLALAFRPAGPRD